MIELLKKYSKEPEFCKSLGFSENDEIEFSMLAQGEYNVNYIFEHPVTGKKLLFRVNTGSQMHLENQIEYEYRALKDLEISGRTPKVYYVDSSKKTIPYGILVMEYLPGHEMDYRKELYKGAEILADIHAVEMPEDSGLIHSANPCNEILDECNQMFCVYEQSELADQNKRKQIRRMLDLCRQKVKSMKDYDGYRCCINTELNSTNFLINTEGKSYLIDWEKPLYGDPGQDLGHFLAPTTTFWKTDVVLSEEEIKAFVQDYKNCVGNRYDTYGLEKRVETFIPVTCMRGLTWCAMAWVEYQQPERILRNESTWKKLNDYLEQSFLDQIEKRIRKI